VGKKRESWKKQSGAASTTDMEKGVPQSDKRKGSEELEEKL